MDDFLAADTVVIGAPMCNSTAPSQLKAWIDSILVAGRTFRYTPDGIVEGLTGPKRIIIAISRGGLYGVGSGRKPPSMSRPICVRCSRLSVCGRSS